jgi:hypothetical protein
LPQIISAIQGVATPDVSTLSRALHLLEGAAPSDPVNRLMPVGDLDGDGVPEMLLRWAMPDIAVEADVTPAPDSNPLWALYLLSWNGAHWQASRLLTGVEAFQPVPIQLGPPLGRGLALVLLEEEAQVPYPVMFQVKDHVGVLLWDAQSDDSRYQPLLQGRVSFADSRGAPAEMIVTGRADPGVLRVDPNGQRGFRAREIYHWAGSAFVPVKTEYSENEDYTLYRFISALHLHDYASAYALVVPAKFMKVESPKLDAFRQFVQDRWPEFLQDVVFEAPEPPAGSPDEHLFVLSKPGKHSVYHPEFSRDGAFRLTGLTRTLEVVPAEP